MLYPKVNRKLPELFELIIETDNLLETLRALSVIPFDDFNKTKRRRWELGIAAEKFIQRQKGGTVI